ncbi:MAG: ExeM/NucH family extracellular endonuclease, partial [Longilinea sp.]|nr:ExeM/NucH family extracellular endonuclease [Longilinea sp.]
MFDTLLVVDVNANQTQPDTYTTGGVTEFEITNPVVALSGSGTADAPYILVNLDTTGSTNIQVSYNVRDIDGSVDNTAQQVALHYRVGNSATWTNVPAAYIADATTGGTATQVTPVSVTLPAAAENQSLVQIRVMTTNANGNDEAVGIDDISVTSGTVTDTPPTVTTTVPDTDATGVALDASITVTFSEAVTLATGWYAINCATSGAHTAWVDETADPVIVLNPADDFAYSELCTVTLEADFIVDEDSPADNMAADRSWSFTTTGADADPSVTSTIPGTGATGIAANTDITIDFSEPVTITPDSFFDVFCSISGDHSGATTGGPTSYVFNPTADFLPGETCTATVQNDQVLDQDPPAQPMAADYVWTFTTTTCGGAYTPIHDIQGSGLVSPINGQPVTTEAVVTAVFQTSPADLNGFFIQAIPGTEDADPLTSEGVFVYHNTLAPTVGDIVRVQATVGVYENQTQLTAPSITTTCSSGNALPAAIALDLPDVADAAFSLEPYEGMLVTIAEPLTVQQNYFQGRYGQVTLGAGGRVPQVNNLTKYTGTDPFYQFTRMIVLDDASSGQNPNPISYYLNDDYMRAGDTITGITGVLDQGPINSTVSSVLPYNWYRLQPTAPIAPANITRTNPRTATPPDVGGRLKIIGTNVLNYFPTLDMAPYRTTFPYGGSNTPRGADTAAEFTRQQDKLVAALAAENGDVYTLMEIESWDGAAGGIGAPQALANALNAYLGTPGLYAVVADPLLGYFDPATETDSDFIQVAMLYKTTTVVPVGASISTDDLIFDRSPFAQEFEEIATGEQFVVVANHFKSKGGCPASGADADQGDGQGCWNAKRMLQSAALLDLIETSLLPLDPDVFVMGDLNAYGAEDPIAVLTDGGLVNQIAAFVPAAERYSYVFDGTAGYLDHALSTATATAQITDVSFWHINADEPSVIDYNTEFKNPDLYLTHQYRSSDHDPVIIGLNLTAPSITWADDAWIGLPDGTEVTPAFPVGSGTHVIGYDAFDTIQEAITAVVAGGTTYVVDGTYTEALYLYKAITLTGAGSATTIVKAPATMPSYTWNGTMNPLVGVDKTTAYISGFTFDGDGKGTGGGQFVGVYFWGSNGSLTDSVLIGMRDATFSGAQDGIGVMVNHVYDVTYSHTVLIQNNQISDYQKAGIVVNELAAQAQILDNIVTGHGPTDVIGQNGIQIGYGAIATIDGNDVSGNDYTGAGWSAAGILLVGVDDVAIIDNNIHENQQGITVGFDTTWGYGGSTGTLVTFNTIVDNGSGIVVDDAADTGLVMHHNRLFGNTTGLDATLAAAAAENNWWGCNAGPNDVAGDCDTITGTGVVDADPWLVLSADFAPLSLPVGGTGLLDADLIFNSAAADTSVDGFVPDTTPAVFTATNGSLDPAATTFLSGVTSSTYTAPAAAGPDNVCIDVDNEQICFAPNAYVLPTLSSLDYEGEYMVGLQQEFHVTLDNPVTGGTFTNVLARFRMSGITLADIASFEYLETSVEPDIWLPLPLTQDGADVIGDFGPPTGFPMGAPYNATSSFRATFNTPGSYPVSIVLYDLATDPDTVLDTLAGTAVVVAEFEVTDLDLRQSDDAAAAKPWTLVPGSYAAGFTMALDPAVEYYYLDTDTLTVNRPVVDGYYEFFVDTAPTGFIDYWAAQGVVAGATGWQGMMWEIINGTEPIFLLKVVGTDYTLVDGLTHLRGQPDAPLKINGSYLPGDYTFTGTVADAYGFTDDVTVDVLFNDIPAADDQAVTTPEEAPLAITLTGVDQYPGTLTYTVVTGPTNGTLSGIAPALTYAPAADFNGTDSFTFTVSDGLETSAPATVTITVTPVNDAPVAVDDTASTNEDTPVNIQVSTLLANDTDVDGDILALVELNNPTNGTLALVGETITFTPAANFNGEAGFDYIITDGTATDTGHVVVTVVAVNDAPVAVDDTASTNEDTPVEILDSVLLANDTDVDLDTLTVTGVSNATNGTVALAAGTITFTPELNFNGTAGFDYTISDGTETDTAHVTVTVGDVNDAPVAVDDTASTNEDTPVDILDSALLANDTDADGDTLSLTEVSNATGGTVALAAGTITFTPELNFTGTAGFDYTVSDGNLTDTGHVTITVAPVNDAPVAVDDTAETNEDTAVEILDSALLANDTDVDLDTLTVTEVSNPTNGTVVLAAGTITFTPAADFNGTAGFDYTVSDGNLTDTGHVTITVAPVNDAPVAVDDTAETNEDT